MTKKIITALVCLLAVSFLCVFNAKNVNTRQFRITEEKLYSNKINDKSDGFLIACFSDLYYGSFISDDYVNEVFETIDSFKPDLILFEGDLLSPDVTLSEEEKAFLTDALSSLQATYGKYAVYGDKDHLRKEETDSILNASGFRILNNASELICIDKKTYINIAGIDSLNGGDPDATDALSGINGNYYTFVVSHCPDIFDSVLGYGIDFLSAGHSRGGQVWLPLISLFGREHGCKKYFRGKYSRNGATLQINNGIGRYKKDARFLADAEIVLYTLKSSR